MKKILIIEDEVKIAKAYSDHLERNGFAVEVAHNGKEGLILATISLPDLILLDIVMPVLDGITMLKQLKLDKRLRQIPVIVLTNLNTSDSVAGAMISGVTAYLVKSDQSMQDLDFKIKEVIG